MPEEVVLLEPRGRQHWRPLIPGTVFCVVLLVTAGICGLAGSPDPAGAALFAVIVVVFITAVRITWWRLVPGRQRLVDTDSTLVFSRGRRATWEVSWNDVASVRVLHPFGRPEWAEGAIFPSVLLELKQGAPRRRREAEVLVWGDVLDEQVPTIEAACREHGVPFHDG